MGKHLGERWKELSAEEKAPYEEMAAADQERYLKEMESYIPPAASLHPALPLRRSFSVATSDRWKAKKRSLRNKVAVRRRIAEHDPGNAEKQQIYENMCKQNLRVDCLLPDTHKNWTATSNIKVK